MKEEKQVASKTKLTLQLQNIGGLWANIEQFEEFRETGPECVYREALITQIQFRKIVGLLGCGTIPTNLLLFFFNLNKANHLPTQNCKII